MQSLQITGPGTATLVELPLPRPDDDEVVVR